MKKIEEIRVIENSHIGGVLGSLFLKHMGDYSMDNEVNVLGIEFHYQDLLDDAIEIVFNHGNTYNLFYMHVDISKKYFETLTNYAKIEFICDCIYKSLLEWAMKFNLPLDPIHVANKKIIENEYFYESSKKYKSKNKKYTCAIEYRYEFDSTTYRLVLLDKKTKKTERYFICNKEYVKNDLELMKTDYFKWLNIPRYLKVKGWLNENEFEMNWGEERYVFILDKREIKILI